MKGVKNKLLYGAVFSFSALTMGLVGSAVAQASTTAVNNVCYPSVGQTGTCSQTYSNSLFTETHSEDYNVGDSSHVYLYSTTWTPTVKSGNPYFVHYYVDDANGAVTYFTAYDGKAMSQYGQVTMGISQNFAATTTGANLVATHEIRNTDPTTCYYNQSTCNYYNLDNGFKI